MVMNNFIISQEEERMLQSLEGYVLLQDLQQLSPFGNSMQVFDTHYLLALDLCRSVNGQKISMQIKKRKQRFFVEFYCLNLKRRNNYLFRSILLPSDCRRKGIRYKVVDNVLFVSMPRGGRKWFFIGRILALYWNILNKIKIRELK